MPRISQCSVPAKTFLIGEYLALVGGPSIVLTFGPRFQLESTPGVPLQGIHPKSPAGRFLLEHSATGAPPIHARWVDPFAGAGGFGASTAQFLATVCMTFPEVPSPFAALELYRSLHREAPLPPSGADLLAQHVGGLAIVGRDPWIAESLQVSIPSLLVFSATSIPDRKTATHDHLEDLGAKGFPAAYQEFLSSLGACADRAISAVRSQDLLGLGAEMNTYSKLLQEQGLESPATTQLRADFAADPRVLGVKGSGALQTDALIVLAQPDADLDRLVLRGEKRGLRCVVRGFNPGPGVETA